MTRPILYAALGAKYFGVHSMFVERKINPSTQSIELWKCEWENHAGQPAKKVFIEKICDEQSVKQEAQGAMSQAPAICWSYGRTLGNIAVYTKGKRQKKTPQGFLATVHLLCQIRREKSNERKPM